MNRSLRLFAFRLMSGAGALIAGIAFFAVSSPAAQASTSCSDCYIVTPATAPATAGAGTGEQYAFQVTNNDQNETLKSLTFTAPADFVVTDASGPSGTSASTLPASSVTLNLPGNAGRTFTIDITALAPCVAASSEVWAVSGTDSLGETDEAQWSSSPLSVSVTGKCSLAFTGQPAGTAVNSDILTGFNSTGSPLAVQLSDANNDPLNPADFSASGTPVTVSIGANPGGGTLAGSTTVNTSNGVADFGNLQINQPGMGYTLIAASTGITPGTSAGFTIATSFQPCPSSTACSGSASSATTSGTATTTSPAPGDFIETGIGGGSYSCGGTYRPVSDAFSFSLFNANGLPQSATLNVSLDIDKSLVQSSGHPGASSWQICYASPSQFTPLPGTSGTAVIGGVTFHTGLLPDCSGTQAPPCVQARHKANAGDVVVTFLAPGDPIGRG
jgi:hypothetical protein